MGNLLRLLFTDKGVVRQVTCCSANVRGLFYMYVKFDYAPDPVVAINTLSKA